MKVALIRSYGGPEAIEIANLPDPSPQPNELLVRVHAASVNPIDWKIARGKVKLILPYEFPLVLGSDVSGEVISVGSAVTGFAPGDAIYGRVDKLHIGTFAEQITVNAQDVVKKPAQLSHAEAAALPLVGLTSWQVLSELGQIGPNQRVLIHAGAGGIGTVAIQIAKTLGAYVITTASAGNHELVCSLGADQIIDYHRENFSDLLSDIDLVFDTIGGQTLKDSFRVLKPGGKLISIAHLPDTESLKNFDAPAYARALLWLANWPMRRLAKQYKVLYRYWFMRPDGVQMAKLSELVETGRLKPIIDRCYPLEKTADAFRYLEAGHARGKVVIEVLADNASAT